MKLNIFKRCMHDYVLVYHIGGDIQNTAYECSKCYKHKVENSGIVGKLSYEDIYIKRLEHNTKRLLKQREVARYAFKSILEVDPGMRRDSIGHLYNCVHVMKISASRALEELKVVK